MALLLFQPIRFKCPSFDIQFRKCFVVVENFGDLFSDEYCRTCRCSNVFNLDTTVTVQNLIFVPLMVLFDT